MGTCKLASNFRSGANAFFEGIVDHITDGMRKAVKDGVKDGAETVELFVATRGTEKSGKQGRIDRGFMIDSVDGEITKDTATEVEGRFGFIDNPPEWTKYQEYGFDHRGGVAVEGMNALSDAAEIIIVQVLQDVEKAAKNA